jgi:acyl-CoA oxidase
MTISDILNLSPKFWQFHKEGIIANDGAAYTLMAIQYNLVAGTIGPFALKRPELRPLLKRILDFDVS